MQLSHNDATLFQVHKAQGDAVVTPPVFLLYYQVVSSDLVATMSENSASSSVTSPLSGASSSSASQQSGQTSTRDKGVLITKSNTTAKEWEYFKVYQYDKETANCSLCKANIRWSRSTSTLTRHLQAKHTKEYAELIKVQVEGRKQETQTGMEAFVSARLG